MWGIRPGARLLILSTVTVALCLLWFKPSMAQVVSTARDDLRTVAELAGKIASAETAEERKTLLDQNRALVTVDLDKALLGEGNQLVKRGNPARALEIFRLAEELGARVSDQSGVADAICGIGYIQYLQGDYALSLEESKKGVEISERAGYKPGIACALNNMGRVENNLGSYREALAHFERSLALEEEIGDRSGQAKTLNAMGVGQWSQGNYGGALEYYIRSLDAGRQLGDKLLVANTLNNIGLVEKDQGSLQKALERFQESLKLREEIGDRSVIGIPIMNIGLVYSLQGNYSLALEYDRTALKITEELGDRATTSNLLYNIGSIRLNQNSVAQAMEYFRRCQRIREDIGDRAGTAAALERIGLALERQGKQMQALENYQKALKTLRELGDRQAVAIALGSIGRLEAKRGNYQEAMTHFEASLQIAREMDDKIAIADALRDIGIVYYAQGAYAKAAEAMENSASIARQIGYPDMLLMALEALGGAYRAMGQPEKAREAFAGAISIVEQSRDRLTGPEEESRGWMEVNIEPYRSMTGLLIDQNKPVEALAFAEQAKARSLIDTLQSGRANVTSAMSGAEKEKEQSLKSRLVSLNSQITKEKLSDAPEQSRLSGLNSQLDKVRLEFEAYRSELYSSHPELRVRRGEFSPISLEDCGSIIPDSNTALLEFFVSEEKVTLFVITRKRPAARSAPDIEVYRALIKEAELSDLTDRFRDGLARRDLAYQETGAKLFDLLIKPASAQLRGVSSFIVVPDGALWELPFQALQSPSNRFLAEDYAISYAPSLTALREMLKVRHGNSQPAKPEIPLLAMGNPAIGKGTASKAKDVFMDAELVPLPQAERQVQALARLYGPGGSRVYTGAAATEDRLKAEASKCRILHLATHAIVNDANPMYSQIYLSQGSGSADDGILEAWEIMELNLNADLVVLSACETARGQINYGEGVVGLTWAVFVAGCPSTVVSQWKVEADATTALMIGFHKNLRAGMSKAEALRRAQLSLIRSQMYSHPFYWAAFVIVGNPY